MPKATIIRSGSVRVGLLALIRKGPLRKRYWCITSDFYGKPKDAEKWIRYVLDRSRGDQIVIVSKPI